MCYNVMICCYSAGVLFMAEGIYVLSAMCVCGWVFVSENKGPRDFAVSSIIRLRVGYFVIKERGAICVC